MHHDSPAASAACACTTLRKAARAVTRAYDDALAVNAMTTAQFAILRYIARGEPLPLSRLAEQLALDRTSLYRALAPIEAKGWAIVAAGEGKTKLASLTAAGRAAIATAETDWEGVQERIVGAMGKEKWVELEAALQLVTELAQRGPGARA
ncbi:MarR family winged helix-turn-helix transcriptional regulator [Sphingomonas naasensis]|nr:helix-turn-helix domain-containing protein [Sphingomonas naasensis]